MKKIIIIGTSCSGKTTLGKKLSDILQYEFIDLDDLHWLPNWQERDDDEFCALTDDRTKSEPWVVAGNYAVVRKVLWPKADTIIWLNYPFYLVLYRCVLRCIRRAHTKETLFAGNVESWRQSFWSKDSMILWVIKTHYFKRKKYAALLKGDLAKNVHVIVFKKPVALSDYLSGLRADTNK